MKYHHIVIMAGGIGSRFWPMSTPTYPKQFIDVMGGRQIADSAYGKPLRRYLSARELLGGDLGSLQGHRTETASGHPGTAHPDGTGGPEHGSLHRLRQLENPAAGCGGEHRGDAFGRPGD